MGLKRGQNVTHNAFIVPSFQPLFIFFIYSYFSAIVFFPKHFHISLQQTGRICMRMQCTWWEKIENLGSFFPGNFGIYRGYCAFLYIKPAWNVSCFTGRKTKFQTWPTVQTQACLRMSRLSTPAAQKVTACLLTEPTWTTPLFVKHSHREQLFWCLCDYQTT